MDTGAQMGAKERRRQAPSLLIKVEEAGLHVESF